MRNIFTKGKANFRGNLKISFRYCPIPDTNKSEKTKVSKQESSPWGNWQLNRG